jgi:hypothetical protein
VFPAERVPSVQCTSSRAACSRPCSTVPSRLCLDLATDLFHSDVCTEVLWMHIDCHMPSTRHVQVPSTVTFCLRVTSRCHLLSHIVYTSRSGAIYCHMPSTRHVQVPSTVTFCLHVMSRCHLLSHFVCMSRPGPHLLSHAVYMSRPSHVPWAHDKQKLRFSSHSDSLHHSVWRCRCTDVSLKTELQVAAETLPALIAIHDMLGSTFGQELFRAFPRFSSVLPGTYPVSSLIRLHCSPVPSRPVPLCYTVSTYSAL